MYSHDGVAQAVGETLVRGDRRIFLILSILCGALLPVRMAASRSRVQGVSLTVCRNWTQVLLSCCLHGVQTHLRSLVGLFDRDAMPRIIREAS